MSATWHHARRDFTARTQGDHGFYDSLYQIAVYPKQEVPPIVVVDHEITHVNLVNKSNLGLLEQVIKFLWWCAKETGDSMSIASAESLIDAIMSSCEITHEAVAWFGTELQTEGFENLPAPDSYSEEITRLKCLFALMPKNPLADMPACFPMVMSIVEEIGIYALNPPLVGEMWAQPERISVEQLRPSLECLPNDPLARFQQLCTLLEGLTFPELQEWARAMAAPSNLTLEDRRRFHKLPVVSQNDLNHANTVRVIRTLAIEIGLHKGALELLSDDRLLKMWEEFKVTHTFNKYFDKYSQVVVLQEPDKYREQVFEEFMDWGKTLAHSSSIHVTLERWSGDDFNFTGESVPESVILSAIPVHRNHLEEYLMVPTYHMSLASVPARLGLSLIAQVNPLVVPSVGYDFSTGDFKNTYFLRDMPHVVVCISDFLSIWMRLAHDIDQGLRGCRDVEWRPMPSPSERKHFGFLLLKPMDNPFPIILNPCIVSQYPRVVSAANALPSPHGVRFIESQGNPYEWLGPLSNAVMAAAALFEKKT